MDESIPTVVRQDTGPEEGPYETLLIASSSTEPGRQADEQAGPFMEPEPFPAAGAPPASEEQPQFDDEAATLVSPPAAPDIVEPAAPLPAAAGSTVASPEKPKAAYTRGEVLGFGLALSMVTLILGVVFSLGFLALINGGLRFPTTARFNDLSRSADTVQRQANALQQDISGLQTRMAALETISGRVTTVEKDTQALKTALDASARQVSELQGEVTGLNQDVDGLKTKTQLFTGFLQGLQDLVNKTLP